MDPDISIWQKTGHFYFALTGCEPLLNCFLFVYAARRSWRLLFYMIFL